MKLLCAVDLSSRSQAVVREAGRWAKQLQGTVDLLYVDDTPDAAIFVGDPTVRAIVDEERGKILAKHRENVAALLAELPEGHAGGATCIPGIAADVVLEQAAAYDAVIVATHGRTGLTHLWLGSVAEKVVRFCSVPVIVTRLPED